MSSRHAKESRTQKSITKLKDQKIRLAATRVSGSINFIMLQFICTDRCYPQLGVMRIGRKESRSVKRVRRQLIHGAGLGSVQLNLQHH